MPFSWLQIIIRRDWPLANDHPEGPYDGIEDSNSWMKLAFFLCKIRFRTHYLSLYGLKHTTKNEITKSCKLGGAGSTLTVSLTVE